MKDPRLRSVAVGLLVLAGCINFIDRSTVSIALPAIKAELHLSASEAGLLLSAFAWSYAAAQLPAGSLVDRLGTRAALSFGLAAWSVVQMLTGLVTGLPSFIAARVALGVGESPMFVGGARVCAERFPPNERAVPLGLLNASASLGPAIAPLVLAPLMSAIGWRPSFAVLGAAGLGVAAAWGLIYRNPRPQTAEAPRIAGPAQWLGLIRQRSVWGLLLGFAGTVYMTWLFVTWLPDYLHERWHMTPSIAAYWSALPQFAGFLGAIAGGWLSDRLAAIATERAARQWPLAIGLYFSALCCMLTAVSGSAALAIAAVSAALFSANLATTSGWALAAALAPASLIATVEAMANIGGSVGGSLAPLVTGALVQTTGTFSAALCVAAAIAVGSAAGNQLMTKAPIAVDPTRK